MSILISKLMEYYDELYSELITDFNSTAFLGSGRSTRYWDCCKPSCSWNGKARVTNPVNTCAKNGFDVLTDRNARNGCENGGSAFTCNNNIPWAINNDLAYGFAAANLKGQREGDWCCKCYQLTFTSGPVSGKRMIVQVTNTGGDLGENHFDLQIPGGGVGIFNGCSSQWGAPPNGWGDRYGGVHSERECDQLPYPIRQGCKWRFQWFKGADNPNFDFVETRCPNELTSKTGCSRI
ncbi:Endoglucanase [Pseudolycoriella hygida]|uniref:Cellulase n=1 Tax=Pseudolycoriella hygida TaxID=35572 RepID=A0A9Q0N4I5_9DIPT|nr:Endoglucanase [Pseudolycoriella hygida]